MAEQLHTPDVTKSYDPGTGGPYEFKTLPYSPGDVYWEADKARAFRLCLMTGGAAVAGDFVSFSTAGDRFTVIAGTTDGEAAGQAMAAIPQNDYGWVQCAGRNKVAAVSDGNVVQGDVLSMHTGNDVKPATEAELVDESTVGVALATDTGTALAIGEIDIKCSTTPRGDFIA